MRSAMKTNNRMKAPKGGDLKSLFIKELKDLYNAENQLVRTLPKLAKAASNDELKDAFDEHFEVTKEHVNRLEKILTSLDQKPTGVKCKAMEGLIAEGKETLDEKGEDPRMKDLGLNAAAQKVEHYEIAGYGTVRTFAQMLGLNDAADMLQQTLDEEGQADKTLTGISETLLSSQDNQGTDEENTATEDVI